MGRILVNLFVAMLIILVMAAFQNCSGYLAREPRGPAAMAAVEAPPASPRPLTAIPAGTTWYWQLSGPVTTTREVRVYDVDLNDNTAESFAALKARGRTVVCYFSAGSYENFRADADQFPKSAIGKQIDDWPGEYWVDVRDATIRSIMLARLDLAQAKGCDGVEPDNLDPFNNDSGVGVTAAYEIAYLKFLSAAAHERGLLIALKNTPELVGDLVDHFDFAVVEQCFEYDECEAYAPFVARDKAVLNAEYTAFSTSVCTKAKRLGFSTAFFNLALDGQTFAPCP